MIGENNIPKHWKRTKASEVGKLLRGVNYKKEEASSEAKENYLPVLRGNNINGELNFEDLVYVQTKNISQEQIIKSGDIVFAMSSGSKHLVGKSAKAKTNFNGSFGAFCGVFRPNENFNKDFVAYFFQSPYYKKVISEISKGTNINNLKREHILDLDFPIPPLPEQQAIVSKIEELLSDLENGKQQLLAAQQQLKVYRQSLLKWAFEGKLTNKNVKDGELPKGWKWVLINDIGKIKGGKRLPPKHEYSKEPTDYAYIMAGNLKDGTVKNKTTFINEETYDALSNYKVIGGEVYITIVGACIGDAGVIPEGIGKSILTENAAKIIELKGVLNKYLSRWINSHNCQLQIKRKILSATLGKLALNRIGTIEVPLPQTEEQQLIIDELESKLTVCDKIEETIALSLLHAETLKQSILKKAFEGELV
jgi:type I restriction enzyme, S subunit